jgi:hypothetical protein
MELFENPRGLAVEFFDDEDETIDVAFIPAVEYEKGRASQSRAKR